MALVTQQMQGSVTFHLSAETKKGMETKQITNTLKTFGRADRCFLKQKLCLSLETSHVCGPRIELLRISDFKGSAQNDEPRSRSSGSKVPKNSLKLSYAPKEQVETIRGSRMVHNIPVSYMPEANKPFTGSPTIPKLFKKWLTMLHTMSPSQAVNGFLWECLPLRETSGTQKGSQCKESSGIIKDGWSCLLGLDATIKIPLLIFILLGLAVNVMYGGDVVRELTPMFIFGPLIATLYIRLLRWLCALYIFSFRQIIKVVMNVPRYNLIGYKYIAQGKLGHEIARVFQPVMDVKNLDYNELSRRKLKELEVLMVENYLDFMELIWPYYCRTVRFLRRASLI